MRCFINSMLSATMRIIVRFIKCPMCLSEQRIFALPTLSK